MQANVKKAVAPTLSMPEFVTLMAFLTSLVALSIDAILPALDVIGAELNATSTQQTHLSVSLFFAGMAVGQLFFGPFADAKGRVPAIALGLLIFLLGSVMCMLASTMEMLLLGRLVQAFGVSGPRIASLAVIRDLYAGNAMARVMSFIMMVFILVPMLAPIVGKLMLDLHSWEAIFAMFMVVGLIGGGWFYLRQPETLVAEHRQPFSWKKLGYSARFVLTHRQVMNYTIAMGCIFGAFLAYISASQTIFQGYYGAGEAFPYIFATLAFSIGLASYFNGRMVMRFGMHALVKHALRGAISFAVILLALLLVCDGLPPLLALIAVLFVGFFFVGILFGNMNAMAMEPLGHIAGLGAALIGSLSSMIAVPVAVLIDSFLVDNVYPIGVGFLVFFSVAKINIKMAGLPHKVHIQKS
ncbi:Bcr/CflA family efflux MFS transporter [Alteromonas sediminis]|uniref:Bcr/CflA family efflux transporter n=1 Tax=Alteromonas sediminis TaxID=2259342 RepID=A0A3N5YMG1_9ALTE|nr:multidrug effflux MFS transporter [Alteromonas sediminis]RPJ66571.1 Bcr/CflA family efflux MFS transporter [Alteromonas sediminis]